MNLLDLDKPKKMKRPSIFKVWWNRIKLGWKIIPTNQLVGSIITGFFIFFGLAHFIYYCYLFFRAYPLVGYILLGIIGLFMIYAITGMAYQKISQYVRRVKEERIYRKIKEANDPIIKKNLLNEESNG